RIPEAFGADPRHRRARWHWKIDDAMSVGAGRFALGAIPNRQPRSPRSKPPGRSRPCVDADHRYPARESLSRPDRTGLVDAVLRPGTLDDAQRGAHDSCVAVLGKTNDAGPRSSITGAAMNEMIARSEAAFWSRARRHLLRYGGNFVPFVPVRGEGAF